MGKFKFFDSISFHFSTAQNTPIYTEDRHFLGRLKDFFVDYEDIYPQVIAIQYQQNKRFFYVAWDDIIFFSLKRITISKNAKIGRSRTYPQVKKIKNSSPSPELENQSSTIEYPPLAKVILDRQVVDTGGKKVIRVNDIEFIRTGQFIRIMHANIGLRSIVRRLGHEKWVDLIIKTLRPNSKYLKNEHVINWKYVHAIPDRSVQSSVKLNLSNEDLKQLHPADLADILEELDGHGRKKIFDSLGPELKAETLSEVEQDIQAALIEQTDTKEAAQLLENMGTDEAADVLHELDDALADEIIDNIQDHEIKEEIQELLEYEEDVAGGIMSTEVFQVLAKNSKEDILKLIQEEHDEFENINDIFVVDENEKLLGTLALVDLLRQKSNLSVSEIMEKDDIKSLHPKTNWREIASFMSKYNLNNVPIVSDEQELLGLVSVDDILPWLLNERS